MTRKFTVENNTRGQANAFSLLALEKGHLVKRIICKFRIEFPLMFWTSFWKLTLIKTFVESKVHCSVLRLF